MAFNIAVAVKKENGAKLQQHHGELMHGALFKTILPQAGSSAADLEHAKNRKSFCLSPIKVVNGRPNLYWFRISGADNRFGRIVREAVDCSIDNQLVFHLGVPSFRMSALLDGPDSTMATGEYPIEPGRACDTIAMHFLTPTTFNFSHFSLPLPLPYEVFRHYLRRWTDAFGDWPKEKIEKYLNVFKNNLVIKKLSISSRQVKFKQHQNVGFTGDVIFKIKNANSLDAETVKQINALAELAFYCGTGSKTTMGMGQTIRLR